MYESNTFPQEWGCGTITPVYRPKDRNTVGNYRGITIQLVISKLYSIVLMTRIKRWEIDNNLIPDAQYGFRKNHNTTDCIFILKIFIDVKIPEQCLYTLVLLIFVKLLIESVIIACGKSLESSDSKKR